MTTIWLGWDKRHLWPEVCPEGYVFLGRAFDMVGEAMFGEAWTKYEVEDAERKLPQRIPSVGDAYIDGVPHYGFHQEYGPTIRKLAPTISAEEAIPPGLWSAVASDRENEWLRVQGARWRRDQVVHEMAELARTGDLVFAARVKGGGEPPLVIEPGRWEIDYPWVPFATLGYHREQGLSSVAPTDWLFVTVGSLEWVLGHSNERPPSLDKVEEISAPRAEAAPQPSRRLFDKMQSEDWYRSRIGEALDSGLRYSRDEDERAGRLVGLNRERIRQLRNSFAPEEWLEGGRPTKLGR